MKLVLRQYEPILPLTTIASFGTLYRTEFERIHAVLRYDAESTHVIEVTQEYDGETDISYHIIAVD